MKKKETSIFPVFLVISERMKVKVEDLVKKNTHLIKDYLIIQERYNQTCNAPQKTCIQISDMENIETLKALATEIINRVTPTHIVAMEEFAVSSAHYLEKIFGLEPKLTLEETLSFRNKIMMGKQVSKSKKLVQPVHYKKQDLINNHTIYPVVVKPIDQAASIGVTLCNNQNEALNAINKISDPIIQDYISDNLCHIDVLIEDNKCIFYSVGCYKENAGFGYINGAPLVSTIETDRNKLRRWREFIDEVIETFNPPNGAIHIEAFNCDPGPHVFLEIGLRPAGGLIPMMIKASSGIDIVEAHFLLSLGMSLEEKCSKSYLQPASLIQFPKLPKNTSPINIENVFLPENGWKSNVFYIKIASSGEDAAPEFSCSNNLADIVFTSTDLQSVVDDTHHAIYKFAVNTTHTDLNFNVICKADIETREVLLEMRKFALEDEFILPEWNLLISSFMFTKHQSKTIAKDFHRLYQIIFSLKYKLFSGSQKQWFKNLGLSDQSISVLQEYKKQGDCIPYRWDFFVPGNQIKVIELNAGLAQGGVCQKKLQELTDTLDYNSKETWVHPLSELADYLKKYVHRVQADRFIIIEDDDHYIREPGVTRWVATGLQDCGIQKIEVIPAAKLQVTSVDRPAIALELFSYIDVEKNINRYKTYFKLVREKLLFPTVSPLFEIVMNKMNLALIYKALNSGLLSPEERILVDKYIPKTFALEESTKEAILTKSKNRYVLKPAIGSGGEGVIVGRDVSEETWLQKIEDILVNRKNYVVQTFVNSDKYNVSIIDKNKEINKIHVNVVFGSYMFNEKLCGGIVRAGNCGHIINAQNGSALGILRVQDF